MKKSVLCIFCAALFLIGSSPIHAQRKNKVKRKNIIISQDLSDQAEMQKVKIGSQGFGKIYNYRFGEYAVVKSKAEWTITKTKSNIWNTKSESKSESRFSFILSNRASDSAIVNAMNDVLIQELRAFPLYTSEHFEVSAGPDEELRNTSFFTSFISTTDEPEDVWLMRVEQTTGTEAETKHAGVIGNQERIIEIIPASSNKFGDDTRTFHAMGYEFVENGESVCALQYYGGGMLGMNKNIVWMKKDLDPRTKLILAAAMTSLMQFRSRMPM